MNSRKKVISIFLLSITSMAGISSKPKPKPHYESELNTPVWGSLFDMKQDSELIFTTIFEKNMWHNSGSASGPGSDLKATDLIRESLPRIIKGYSITSMLDIPCGDFYWFRTVDLGTCKYIGIDVVKKIVEINNKEFGNDFRTFKHADATSSPLPKVDLIFSRDMLVHFDLENIVKTLKNFKKSGSRYVLMTTFLGDLGGRENREIKIGDWRPLDFQRPPFNFPAPLCVVQDRGSQYDTEGKDKKYLGLWLLEDLPI